MIKIPNKSDALTFLWYKIAVIKKPIIASRADIPLVLKSSAKLMYVTKVESLFTIICAP